MNILVIRLSALGDVAMTIPAIYSVARAYPQHSFSVVTSAFAARLFINAPSNVEVIGLANEESRGVVGTWRLLMRLRRLKVDAVADLHNVLRSWVIDVWFRMSGKRVVMMDKMRNERKAIIRRHAHATRIFALRYFDVFTRLGLYASPSFKSVYPGSLPPLPDEFPAKASDMWVGIAPFARYRSKICDETQMQGVVSLLSARHGCRIFLFGARGREEQVLQRWAGGLERVHVIAGQMPLEDELALMARLDVMLSMDSANMHMASLVGTRVVSFWGGTTPACGFLGYGQDTEDALVLGLPCQPCSIAGSDTCPLGHMRCTSAITADNIVNRLISKGENNI